MTPETLNAEYVVKFADDTTVNSILWLQNKYSYYTYRLSGCF
jgi:hypothetical protein